MLQIPIAKNQKFPVFKFINESNLIPLKMQNVDVFGHHEMSSRSSWFVEKQR